MEQRKAFNFLRSYYEVLKEIHRPEDKLNYLLAILDKQFEGIEPNLQGIPKLSYVSQRHSIDQSRKGWEDKVGYQPPTLTIGGGQGGMVPPTEGPTEPPTYTYPQETPMTTEGGTEGGTEPPSVQEQEQGQVKGNKVLVKELLVENSEELNYLNSEIDTYEYWLNKKKINF